MSPRQTEWGWSPHGAQLKPSVVPSVQNTVLAYADKERRFWKDGGVRGISAKGDSTQGRGCPKGRPLFALNTRQPCVSLFATSVLSLPKKNPKIQSSGERIGWFYLEPCVHSLANRE